ncbi:thiol-disulfide oxidoreductase ResA [mine drainage metagenome]|uniref:Thiol-disulfide oxidoreductase ResA n=1 Tax=mine drainage metagenome TaxID=410659 RepID=A0A1J5RIS5_9ZZZZ
MPSKRALAALLLTAWCLCGGGSRAALAEDLSLGQPAPPLTLHSLDGRVIPLDSLRGRVVILAFWATWCAPCQQELPLLSAYAARHAAQGLTVLGFSLDGAATLPRVRRMAAGLSFPVGLLGSAWAGGYGRMWRLPVSFVIDRHGVLRYDGWDDDEAQAGWTQPRLDRIVGPLLEAAAR